MDLAPIALFVYNRLSHTEQTVSALLKNELAKDTELFVYCDGAKKPEAKESVEKVRQFVRNIKGFKSIKITERNENFGLPKSIITGVTEIVNKFGKIIVMEDDLVTNPYFLRYMNDALEFYKDEEDVISIHGYVYPVKKQLPDTYFIKGADCWGWATWKRGWDIFDADGSKLLEELRARKLQKEFDFNYTFPYTGMLEGQVAGEIGSWAIRWYASAFLKNKLTLYPGKSLVKNIGNDGTGSNCPEQDQFNVTLWNEPLNIEKIEIKESRPAKKAFEVYFQKSFHYRRSLIRRMLSKIKRLILNKNKVNKC
jgi:hypothetical protein